MRPTDKQLDKLAGELLGTTSVASMLAERLLGVDLTVADIERMRTVAGVFQCAECGEWKDMSNEDATVGDFCTACIDEINATLTKW